jgi:hypothetical protein
MLLVAWVVAAQRPFEPKVGDPKLLCRSFVLFSRSLCPRFLAHAAAKKAAEALITGQRGPAPPMPPPGFMPPPQVMGPR